MQSDYAPWQQARSTIAALAPVAHNGYKSVPVKVVQAAKVTPSSKLRAGGAGAVGRSDGVSLGGAASVAGGGSDCMDAVTSAAA